VFDGRLMFAFFKIGDSQIIVGQTKFRVKLQRFEVGFNAVINSALY
jgi:hypothetical protein